tara:strand:+ start:2002 stop:2706 length:705 start_codon:yes stop_codon:yes gene_type:complete
MLLRCLFSRGFSCVHPLTILLFGVGIGFNAIASINVTSLADDGIKQWQEESFVGNSTYNVVEYNNRLVLKAESDGSASGLVLKKRIDLLKTPYINWSWLTKNKLPAFDEKSKAGDDYVARVYVVIDGGWMIWKSQSLSYVWSSNQNPGQVWDNAFVGDKVQMISVRGKQAKVNQWYTEKRNVYQDLIDHFGDKGSEKKNQSAYRYIDVIAIMTDTDNSLSKAESYYSDIIFSED